MASPINPIVSGLLTGFGLAHQIKSEKRAQQQFEMQQRQEEQQTQLRDLQTQIGLQDRGYHEATPDQEAEIATGRQKIAAPDSVGGRTLAPFGMGNTVEGPSDIKTRLAKYNGKTYVRDTDEEVTRRDLAHKMTEAKALGDQSALLAADRAAKMLEATGFTVDDTMAAKLHLKAGQKFPAEKIDDLMRAFSNEQSNERAQAQANKPKAIGHYLTREKTGNAVTIYDNGTTNVSEPLGLPPVEARPTAPRAGATITPYQQAQLDRQKKRDEEKAKFDVAQHDAARAEWNDLDKEVQRIHQQDAATADKLRLAAQTRGAGFFGAKGKDAQGKTVTLTPAAETVVRKQLAANAAAVLKLQQRQYALKLKYADVGAPAPAAQPAAAPVPGGGGPLMLPPGLVNPYRTKASAAPAQ